MKLAVCCLARGSAEQLEAVLEPLRPVTEEVVVAYDDRVDERRRCAYAGVADRLVPMAFEFHEHHLAGLYKACQSEWVLRIDANEVPSAALAERLARLEPGAAIHGYAVPRRWLDPSGRGWIDEIPWYPDYQLRLVRNDEHLKPSGEPSTGVTTAGPEMYLAEPLYHLACALFSREVRQRDALVRELLRPGIVTAQGLPMVSFHDPELYASRPPASVPEEDRPLIASVLRGAGTRPRLHRGWARRSSRAAGSPGAGEVLIEVLERDLRLFADRPRLLSVKVTNRSTITLPATRVEDPTPVVLGSRLRWADGTARDAMRATLPVDLPPSAEVVLQMPIAPVGRIGPVELQLDMVEEHVRWFGCLCPVATEAVLGFQPATRRETPIDRRRRGFRRRRRTSAIPFILHRVWLGDQPMPDEHRCYGESWRRHHRDWEHRLWSEENIPDLPVLALARHFAERSNIVRCEILRRHGGVYVDTDVECLRPIDELLAGVEAFAAYEVPGRVCNAVMGARPGHPAMSRLCELVEHTVGLGHPPTGPLVVTRALEPRSDVTLFGPERFYPYLWDEAPGDAQIGSGTYAVHHWAMSWMAPAGTGAPG